MTRALVEGVRRVIAAPALVLGISAITFVTAAPLGWAVRNAIEAHLGASVMADSVATGIDATWWEEFHAQATGVASTFEPRILGFAAVLSNLGGVIDGAPISRPVLGVVLTYLLLWTLLTGGVLDRLARHRRVGAYAFCAACGAHVARLFRLVVVAGLAYWWLFAVLHPWLFESLFEMAVRDFTTERSAFLVRLAFYAAFAVPLCAISVLFDYAKIRTVVEDRRSAVGAILAAARFIRRHTADVVGLYLLNGVLFLVVLSAYAMLAPSVRAGTSLWPAVVIGQIYIVSRVAAKLVLYASHVSYFQSQLAHAGYVAAPPPQWPESPASEALGAVVR